MHKQIIRSLVASAVLTAAAGAQAFTVNYLSQTPTDGSGKTSVLLNADNTARNNVFVETFDVRNQSGTGFTGGINTPPSLVTVTAGPGGGFDFAQGTSSSSAAPAGDSTYYAYGPKAGSGTTNAEVTVDYTGLLGTLGTNASLNYFGLYYGSIDTYNNLTFYNRAGQEITTITGAFLIDLFNGTSGNQNADSSNIYVNLFFTPEEEFASFKFTTTGIAFEMDNLAVGFQVRNPNDVPEPGSLALLGLGMAALGLSRRRKPR